MTMKAKILLAASIAALAFAGCVPALAASAMVPAAPNAEETEPGRRGEDSGSPRLRSSETSALSAAGLHSTAVSAVIAETLLADGTTNAWTQADLVDALGLLNRRYRRDIETEAGRRAWHGRETAQALVTNAAGRLVMRRTYADGFAYDDEARRPTAREAASNAARRVRASLPTNGVPARLAALRTRTAAMPEGAETNVTVTAGGPANATPRWTLHRDAWGNVTNRTLAGWTRAWYVAAPDGTRFLRHEVHDATGGLVRATCRAVAGPSAAGPATKGKED